MELCRLSGETWNQRFSRITKQFADKTAIIEENRSITYGELNRKTNRLAGILREEGIAGNGRVAIMMNNSIEAVTAIMAVLKAGGSYVPINPKDAPERKKRILKDSESRILIISKQKEDAGIDVPKALVYEDINFDISCAEVENLNQPEDEAYLLYTSGSTGTPKGAVITHNNVCRQMEGITNQYGFTDGDVWTQFHTICFDFSVLEIFGCLYSGGTLLIVPEHLKYNSQLFMDFITQYQVTVLGLVPSVLYRIPVEKISGAGLRLHTMILGGEKLSFSKLKGWFEKLPELRIVNGYGLTETTIFNMGKTITRDMPESTISSIGQVFSPNQVCIVENGQILGVGETGEICLGGPAISPGYWKNPQLNEQRYIKLKERGNERFFRTGDLGRLLENGEIEFIGRADNQVKIRGFRVEIEEVENRLRLCELVKDVAVKTSADASQLWCFAVLKAGDKKALQEYAAKNLPPYMVPARWVLLEELPLTERGKVDKSKLTLEEREGFLEEYVPCTTETERELLSIWQADFPEVKIGVRDSYYELGGNSLSVINMLEQAGRRYQTELSLVEFMQEPTIYGLSCKLEQSKMSGNSTQTEKSISFGKYGEIYPMTDLQQAFFIGRQTDVELGNCASHSYAEIRCQHYDGEKFRQVLDTLIHRHDLLRCYFDEFGNHHIMPSLTYDIPLHDFSKEEKEGQQQKIQEVRNRMENMILDYTKAPLARVEVSLMGNGEALIHFYMDALIADGWSHELLLYEADQLYSGEQRELSPLAFHYGDFVEYTERVKETEKYKKAREFWLSKIPQLPENPMLPVKKKTFQGKEIASEQRRKVIRWDIWRKIEAAANAMGLSAFVVSFTAFCKVIARYSKNQRFVINLPVSNRPNVHPDMNRMVGVCSNFFLFDYENLAGETLFDTAKRVQKQMWALKENDSFNGNEIIREIYKESGKVGSFVATIVFTSLLDIPFPPQKNLERVYLETHTSQIWMDTVLMSDSEGVSFNCDFVKGLLEKDLVNQMMGDWVQLLEQLAQNKASWEHITALELPQQQKELWEKNNLTQMELPKDSVFSCFLKKVRENPQQTAIATIDTVLTYQELYERMLCINQQLEGTKPGEAVAVVTNKSWYQVTAVLAILSRGGSYVPVDEAFPAKTIEHCMKISGASVCLTDNENQDKVQSISGVRAVNVEALSYTDGSDAQLVLTTPEEELAIIFTSGTTGMPKGIRLKQMGVLNSVKFTNERYRVGAKDRALALTNLCHDMSMYDIFGMLAAGGTIVIPEKEGAREPQHWMKLMRKYQVTVFNSVPAFAEMLFVQEAEAVKESTRHMRLVIHGGDFLKPSLAEHWLSLSETLQLVNVGGPTETSLWSVYHDVTKEEAASGNIPYGKPIANMKHYILNDIQEEVPLGVIGTIYSEGVGLAVEYVGQPELTKEKFIYHQGKRLFQTGDLGYYSPEGELIICGRDDNQIKINGKRIELEEIEKQADGLTEIEASCVVYQKMHKKLVLYYKGSHELEKSVIQTRLEKKLPHYMIPSVCIRLDALPLTRNGKINRRHLAEQKLEEPKLTKEQTQHYQDALEEDIYREAARLLGRTSISKGANFFMEGGNSILAIRLLAYLKQKYGVTIGLGEIFSNPCMDTWHDLIVERKQSGDSERATSADGLNEKHILLSPAQSGIWFYENISVSPKYTVCAYMKLAGQIDVHRLTEALCGILEEHSVFQLNYAADEKGVPYQFVNTHDLSKCVEYVKVHSEKEAARILQEEAAYKFDIKKEPLCRFRIVQVNPELHYLITVVHHLITDETSVELLAKEIMGRYQGKVSAQKKDMSYLEYCIHKSGITCDTSYWRKIFHAIDLQEMDFVRAQEPEVFEDERGCIDFTITKEMAESLKGICQRKGCTTFSALYSLYMAALYLHTGKPCIATVSTYSDRMEAAYANAYGMFVYNQCVVYQAALQDTLSTLMDKIKEQILQIYHMPLCSFNDIIRELELPSEYLELQNHQVFTYVDNDRASVSCQEIKATPVEIVKKVNDVNLDMLIERLDGQLIGHLYYSYRYLSKEQAEQLLHQFQSLIKNGLRQLDDLLLNLIEEEEGEAKRKVESKDVLELEEDLF